MIKPSKTISKKVLEKLEHDIYSGTYPPGSRLVEGEIASSMGVSRGPVREALLALTRRGLVKEKEGNAKGREIVSLTPSDIKDYFQIRILIETQCLLDIATNDDKTALIPLVKLQKTMQKLFEKNNIEDYIQYNTKFHHEIVKSAGNDKLYKIYSENDLMIRWFRVVTLTKERMAKSNEEHALILDLCQSSDVAVLIKVVSQHQTQAMVRIINKQFLSF